MLEGKKILLGITGSIAAYKTSYLVREFVKKGAEVKVIMTATAKEFITPLTLATLSKNPILVDFFDPTNGNWNSHVKLGLWADVFIIAPASANTIGKMAHGIADNLLLTSYLSCKCPVFVAPAMDLDMYAHPSTQENIATLRKRNNHIIEATSGQLASGLEGKGRMEEPAIIAEILTTFFNQKQQLLGKKIVITAGPTYEKIDPVRFIGNYSSGKMGYAIAEECAEQGANVILISGPVERNPQHANITKIAVESASEMSLVTKEYFPSSDVAILSAAVADFTPTRLSDKKIKREKESLTMELLPTEDIAASLGKMKKESQRIVGFALETTNEKAHAFEKLQRKNLDFIVLNSLNDKQAGFGYDTNKISIIDTQNVCVDYDLKTKQAVAKDIVEKLITILP
ncbi:MAG: bifunctional phosphopantothenoylcysteine decarboxylase/phosphopantothenate--cysteine ligase CoaBC [Paludibacteraceae bacterium]|nr:bifunctional phosphopantothenoylcysteine decarboxylase/phosphopantothenate--cysteine ligase CoaBC [Paludibacteraceae bacterium]